MSPGNLAKKIINNQQIDGVTISGGEPFEQAGLLATMLRKVKSETAFNVICFTGYLLKNLTWRDAKSLLQEIDVLIDGPFISSRQINKGLRGSSNQRIHFLTERMASYRKELIHGEREFEIVVQESHSHIIGIPTLEILNQFRRQHE